MSQLPLPVSPGWDRTISAGSKVDPVESDRRQFMMIGPASYLTNKIGTLRDLAPHVTAFAPTYVPKGIDKHSCTVVFDVMREWL